VQQATVVLSHEVSEAITDPDTRSGWFDPRQGEIGDITAGQIGSMGGYAVQALWSQVDGRAVIPTGAGDTVPAAASPVPASAGSLRSMGTTWRAASANTTFASFMATFAGADHPSSSPPTGSQEPPTLLAGQAPASGAVLASTITVPASSATSTGVGAIPHGSPGATSLRAAQNARNDSGGDDHLPEILEDELLPAGSALPGEEALPPAARQGLEQEVLPALQSDAALWQEASTAYFAQQGAAAGSVGRPLPAPRRSAADGSSASPGAAAAALALVLGTYCNIPADENSPPRRRPGHSPR
jgi:hypothetical protein